MEEAELAVSAPPCWWTPEGGQHHSTSNRSFAVAAASPPPKITPAMRTSPLVRPRAHSNSWVKVPTGGEADPS